jgi:hypothetical protein
VIMASNDGERKAARPSASRYQLARSVLAVAMGEGVPANADLARAWYAAAGLLAAQERLAEVKSPAGRPASVRAPEPLFPAKASALEPGSQKVDLVWTSAIEPEAVRYFVELRLLDAGASREV